MFVLLLPAIYCLKFNFRVLLEWNLISFLPTPVIMSLVFDRTRLLYSTVVILISANVLRFSTVYIRDDKFINRFTLLVVAFIISINLLIYIPHLIILLIGWDGLGITSFILVVYYQNSKSLRAGLITALTNRIGDVAILLSIGWTLSQGHWNILHIRMENSYRIFQISAITLAAITKSAQIPFSRWLPAAIAAPTPVSALVHSSTLVTAGVFLLIRFYPFLRSINIFNKFILFIAVSTIIIAGIRATTECDIKKIIALSTLRQLGIIITRIGLGFPQIAFIHIVIHALFKALLFICAGNLIRLHRHAQDLRWIGNTLNAAPVTATCILIANTALCGFPFIAGFYSKDLIIETAIFSEQNRFIVILILLSVGFTSFYSMRFSIVTIWGPRLHKPHSSMTENIIVVKPIIIMATLSIITGSIMLWSLPNYSLIIRLPLSIKLRTIILILSGAVLGWATSLLSTNKRKLIDINISHYASCIIWFLVPLSSQFVLSKPIIIGHYYLKIVDQAWLERIGGQGSYNFIIKSSSRIIKNRPVLPNSYLIISILATISLISITLVI
jgi:NADH-ubiquinone oxidoreductase chain 5